MASRCWHRVHRMGAKRACRARGRRFQWLERTHPRHARTWFFRHLGTVHPSIEAGEIYKYEILNANNEWTMKADPMERSHEIPPRTGSIVVESTHE